MSKPSKKNKQGFSLIEVILYLVIVAILLTAVINLHLTLGGTATKLGANIEVSRNRRYALTNLEYLIRNSDGLLKDPLGHCSDFDASPPVLSLYFSSDDYLPGTCVETAGGADITVANGRMKMTCYPNITNNGQHQACTASSTAVYYLTSPNVNVANTNISFATSTATSTDNGFTTVITKVSVTSLSGGGQTELRATSTATSTVLLRNEQPDGLVSWWKFDDASGSAAVDSVGNNDATCYGTPDTTAGIHTGSSGAFDFNYSESDYCEVGDPDNLNFEGSFSLAAWVKMNYTSTNKSFQIVAKYHWGDKLGYSFTVFKSASVIGRVWNRLFDGNSFQNAGDTVSGYVADATVYHITSVINYEEDTATTYIFQKGVGGVNTTTKSTLPLLVATDRPFRIAWSPYFDGIIDDLRVYNRALTASEVWALQSED